MPDGYGMTCRRVRSQGAYNGRGRPADTAGAQTSGRVRRQLAAMDEGGPPEAPVRFRQVRSNSPSRAPRTKARHSAGVKISEGPSGLLPSLMAI